MSTTLADIFLHPSSCVDNVITTAVARRRVLCASSTLQATGNVAQATFIRNCQPVVPSTLFLFLLLLSAKQAVEQAIRRTCHRLAAAGDVFQLVGDQAFHVWFEG